MLVDVIFLTQTVRPKAWVKEFVVKFIWYVIFVYFLAQQVVILICRFSI